MKIGDKVRCLNTTGVGVVRGSQGKDIVLVEDEEGFDIPVLIRETVLIEPANDMQVRQSTKSSQQTSVQQTSTIKQEEEYKPEETKEGELLTVNLA